MQGLGVMLGLFGSLGIVAIILWVEDLIIRYKLLKDDIKNNYTLHDSSNNRDNFGTAGLVQILRINK